MSDQFNSHHKPQGLPNHSRYCPHTSGRMNYFVLEVNFQSSCLEPYTEILGGPDIYLEEGFTMNLTCLVRGSPEPPQYIFWYRNQQVTAVIIRL